MRISYKRCTNLCTLLNDNNIIYEIIKHQNLGNRRDYFYTYSLGLYDNEGRHIETVLHNTSLKSIHDYLCKKLDI